MQKVRQKWNFLDKIFFSKLLFHLSLFLSSLLNLSHEYSVILITSHENSAWPKLFDGKSYFSSKVKKYSSEQNLEKEKKM